MVDKSEDEQYFKTYQGISYLMIYFIHSHMFVAHESI